MGLRYIDSSLKLSSRELEESLEGLYSGQDNGEGLTSGVLPNRCFEKERGKKWKIERRNRPFHPCLFSLGKGDSGSVNRLLLETCAPALRGGYNNRSISQRRKLRLQQEEYLTGGDTDISDCKASVPNHRALLASL